MQHKVDWGPGYRLFLCSECCRFWIDKSRHCESQSGDGCSICGEWCIPYGYERHYEWPTDASGNLIETNINKD
jgi:hypothetical protein